MTQGWDWSLYQEAKVVEDPNSPMRFVRIAPTPGTLPVMILYGTEYGFSQSYAKEMQKTIVAKFGDKYYPRVVNMEEYEVAELDKEQIVLIICSTYGDGVPPTRARPFFDWLEQNPQDLSKIQFSVLAMGDKGYPHFARAGRIMDEVFEKYGAKRFSNRVDVDLEDPVQIERWTTSVMTGLESLDQGLVAPANDYLWDKVTSGGYEKKISFGRSSPLYAKVTVKKVLTKVEEESDKETFHMEFDLGDSGMQYIVGDSLGIIPHNHPEQVDEVLRALKMDPNMPIPAPSWKYPNMNGENPDTITIREGFLKYYDLKNLKAKLLEFFLKEGEGSPSSSQDVTRLRDLLSQGVGKENQALGEYLKDRELIDIVENFPSIKLTSVEQLLGSLGQLLPRYYSISSSYLVDPKTVSVTIAVVRYKTHGRSRVGICSTHLNDRVQDGDILPIFVNNNPDFRLPADPTVPILMVGPGTGVAPFRAMLHERIHQEASGKSVLYFGCRNEDRDFLYREEFEKLTGENKMTLRTAFSRQKSEKVYVQQRLRENAAEVWDIISAGGHVYVCGDAQYMAVDVHSALEHIVAQHIGKEGAAKYVEDLEKSKRYQKDVWF